MQKNKHNFRNPDMELAWERAGVRERFAMEHGNKTVWFHMGQEMWKFTYSKNKEYQDANGATYNVTLGRWVS